MFRKTIITAMAILGMSTTSVTAAGFLGKQYLAVGYQNGEFGDDGDSELLDNTKGLVITYNHPVIDKIDVGGISEYNFADGKDRNPDSLTDVDYSVGGAVTYATFYSTKVDPLKFFITPQLGIQRARVEYKKGGLKKNSTDTDLYFGLENGFEYQVGRFTLVQSVAINHTDDIDINAKGDIGFDLTERVALIIGGDYQLNDDHDYTLKTGFVVRF